MTWQLGSFSLLALALTGGFVWYERTRPDARIVALVGTLAAFAALGRIAFAALPNVKPTTDIVLISGYALGGAPGFVVGALAGLTSNFFFGQGPFTPWQMAGWGVTGLFGAGLALITARRIGRWPLALACAAIGFLFTVLQDFGDWVTYSDHSTAQLGVYLGKGVGFDAVHAAGCLGFALAFGPSLTHSIRRFARRLDVTWRPVGVAGGSGAGGTVAVVVVVLMLGAGLTTSPSASAAAGPESYLLGAQQGDGGFGAAPAGPSSALYAGWAALGLAAAGHNPLDVSHGGPSLLAYIRAGAGSLSDVGSLERTILVAQTAGVSPHSFGGRDLVAGLQGFIRPDGSVSEQVNLTAFGVMALRAAAVAPPARTITWLAHQQNSDGGFSFATAGGASDIDDTGAALEALGGGGRVSARAVAFIRAQQNSDGGFPSTPGDSSNAQSTSWAVQGLLAAGTDPNSLRRGGAPSPLGYLRSLIAPDGHVRYSQSADQTPVWVTAQALMALALKPLPIGLVPAAGSAAAGSGAPSPARKAGHRVVRHHAAVRHRARRPHLTGGAASNLQRLAGDAGVFAALVLAPVGLG